MNRIVLAFRCFFNLLFAGELSAETLTRLNLTKRGATPAAAPSPVRPTAAAPTPAAPSIRVSDGALQLLAIMQRDSRMVDFLMEDISGAADDQIGAAVREVHAQCRDAIGRYLKLEPVIDGVEGTYTKTPGQNGLVKFVGNVPANAPSGGTLRHKGWRATKVDLPVMPPKQDPTVIAPAEIEIE